MKIDIYKNAHSNSFKFVSSSNMSGGGDMSHISKFSFGAIYTENGTRIDSSIRIGGIYGDKVLDCSPSFFKLNSYKKVFKGKTIYLGPFMCIMDTLLQKDYLD